MKVIALDSGLRRDHKYALKRDFIKKRLFELITIAVKAFKGRDKLPTICVLGRDDSFKLLTPVQEDYEERRLDCRCYPCDSNLNQILIRDMPQVIITIGNRSSFSNLITAPFEIRKRWLHYETMPDLTQVGTDAYNHYGANMFNHPGADDSPLVTVFTPTYRTGGKDLSAFPIPPRANL